MKMPSYLQMFLAFPGGALVESSPLALLIGSLYIYKKGHIDWQIPASIFGTVAIIALLLGQDLIYHFLAGGLIIGSIFMAIDWATSLITASGKIIFGVAILIFVYIRQTAQRFFEKVTMKFP